MRLTTRQVIALAYYDNHRAPGRWMAMNSLKGQMTSTKNDLIIKGLTIPSEVFPYTALTDLGKRVLASYTQEIE